jgi:protein gp37
MLVEQVRRYRRIGRISSLVLLGISAEMKVKRRAMGERTGIEWADATWNPWMGCHKVSEGCRNCYMFREQEMYGRDPGLVVRSKTRFEEPLRWVKNHKVAAGGRVFVCSWSDFFIAEADPIRDEAWEIMRRTPEYMYLIPTKRVERAKRYLPEDWGQGWPNVMILASVENQATLEKRLPLLLSIPARWRGLSVEPMIGPVDLVKAWPADSGAYIMDELHWVICGGESGPERQEMEAEWAQTLMMDCYVNCIPFFMKQMGGWPDKRGKWEQIPEALQLREFPAEWVGNIRQGERAGEPRPYPDQ